VKHFGFATAWKGPEAAKRAFAHLLKVNGWTKAQGEAHIGEMFKRFVFRSGQEWILDVSWLEQSGIRLSKVKSKKQGKKRGEAGRR
jgi:hypothetical protein